jgi:Multimeric flavodoxin WrbA
MKVLLVNGSPKEKGCTFTALSEIKGVLENNGIETDFFHLGKAPVHGCIGCRACGELGKCVFDDDVCNSLADEMKKADGIILGSPVYYAGANGAFCAVLDRVFYSQSRSFEGKPGAAIVSCRRGGASSAFDRLNKYFTISSMPVVPSQYWNAVHGNTPEDVAQDKEGLQIMRTLGANMAWMLKSLQNNPTPKREPREWTNFIKR